MGVRFGVFVDTAPHFGGKSPQTPMLEVRVGVLKPNRQNIESFILLKIQHRFQPNLCTTTEIIK